METRDITCSAMAMRYLAEGERRHRRRRDRLEAGPGCRAWQPSVRDGHVTVVDQIVEHLPDVDIALDHAGLLQREASFQDRVPLRRADPIMGQLGALLELLVDHRLRQCG